MCEYFPKCRPSSERTLVEELSSCYFQATIKKKTNANIRYYLQEIKIHSLFKGSQP